ncbi:aquaporin-3-like isoform X1 [Mobula birostris]|uniref:aquaporin-3-like isoform X1 n=1 Tax=Mobula birostris TaxID=1983395 RepID=UPI003B2823A8
MGKQKAVIKKLENTFKIQNLLGRQCLAECLGTLILVLFGCGALAQVTLSRGTHGQFLTVNFAFGFSVMLGVLIAGQVSGAHLNPAVTFAMCLLAREPWIKFPLYSLSQIVGGFLASGIIFGLYFDALWDFSGQDKLLVYGPNATAGIFATYPSEHLSPTNGFFDQMIGTTALIVCILTIVDKWNNPVPKGLEAFTVGFTVLVIGLSMGFNSGYAVNPARDFGPRLFTSMAGWGADVFTAGNYWFWIPIFAPLLGSVLGILVYQLMIGIHLEPEDQSSPIGEENIKLANIKLRESC